MALPVQFKIDSKCVYVSPHDSAWDIDRFEKEEKKSKKKKKELKEYHPLNLYFSGLTRFDIEMVKEYLDMSKNPFIFRFRRLKMEEYETVRSRASLGDADGARRLAVMFALEGMENVPIKIDGLGSNKIIDIDQIEELSDVIGRETLYSLGEAIIKSSGDLTDYEKKR